MLQKIANSEQYGKSEIGKNKNVQLNSDIDAVDFYKKLGFICYDNYDIYDEEQPMKIKT